jgi:hypothetical protein
MSNENHSNKQVKPSKLEQFNLGFEYNETWAEARKKYTTSKK